MIPSTESEEYEIILGHSGQLKYYVKIAGQPYSRSKWITKRTLLNSTNGSELLHRYNHAPKQRSSPPFYPKEYDIPDHIISKDGNLYLIKWTHLFHDNLTWEEKVDKSLLLLYKNRKSSVFPSKNNENMTLPNVNFLTVKKLIVFPDYIISTDILEQCQFILNSFESQDEVVVQEVDNGDKSVFAISTFIYVLLKKRNDPGPYLIIVEPRHFNQWYDLLTKINDVTTLAYNGSLKSRKVIHDIDFIDEKGNLNFQVLLTIPAVFESDIEILRKIDWKYGVTHLYDDILMRFKDVLKIFKTLTFLPLNEQMTIKSVQLIHHVLESELFNDELDPKDIEEFNQLYSKHKIPTINAIENTFFFVVECPMTDVQKYICKHFLYQALSKSFENDEKPNFRRILRIYYYIMQHPFLFPKIESIFSDQNFIYLSTKMRVLRKLISNVQIEFEHASVPPNILVCTKIHQVYQLLIDFVNSICIEHVNLFLFEANTAPTIPFKSIHTAILYDGSISYWKQFVNPILGSNSNVYKLEVLDCRENETPTDENAEELCKTISFQILIPSGKIPIKRLLDENISLDLIHSDPCYSSFSSTYFTDESFWLHLCELLKEDSSSLNSVTLLSSIDLIKKNIKSKKNVKQMQAAIDEQLNLRHQHQFIRSFMEFGWGNWQSIIDSSGINIDVDTCINYSLQFMFMMKNDQNNLKNFVSNLFLDLCLQNEFDTSDNQFEELRNSLFLNEECFEFNERVLAHACLNHVFGDDPYTPNDIDEFDFSHLDNSKPEIWWTSEHDKALLYSIYRNGYGNYISVYIDDFHSIESSKSELFNRLQITLNQIVEKELPTHILNQRQRELLEFITSYVFNDLRCETNNLKQLFDTNWSMDEQNAAISYLLHYGIDLDDSKQFEETVEKLLQNTDVKIGVKTHEQITDFLEFIKNEINRPTPNTGLSIFTVLRLRTRIITMEFLHRLIPFIDATHYTSFFSHLPKWKICDQVVISSELEAYFLTAIEQNGFGSISMILNTPKFATITDPTVITYMKDEYRIMLHLAEIREIEKKNELFAPQTMTSDNQLLARFGLEYPIPLNNTSFIENFGVIRPDLPNFHQERYLYPIGFKTSRLSTSLKDPEKRVKWFSEIVKEGDLPIFRVWEDGLFDQAFEGFTATGAWTAALKKAKRNKNVSVSGPDMFLLTHPVVRYFLQKLPGASLCKKYISKKEDSNPIVVQFLSENHS